MYQMLDAGEWADNVASTPDGQCLETAITKLVGKANSAGQAGQVARELSKAEIDAIVYKCRQDGNDTTYDIVRAAISADRAARSAAQSTAPAPAEAQMSIKRIAELAKQSEYEEPGHGRKTLDRIAFARAIEAEVAARFRAEGGNTKPEAGAGLGVKSAETRMDTGFDASAGFAPVSTEQAGDATFEYRTDAEDIWHKAPLAELEQIASDGFQVRAPSPNNSPVGGKDKA